MEKLEYFGTHKVVVNPLSMLFYAHLLCETINSPTILVLTDRNDLDDQLFSQFSKCKDFLYQVPNKAESREHLKNFLLEERQMESFFNNSKV